MGHEIVCEECRNATAADVASYATTRGGDGADLQRLIDQTKPGLRKVAADHGALMERVRRGTLSGQEREKLVLETLASVSPLVSARAAQIHIDAASTVAGLVTGGVSLWLLVTSELEGPLYTLSLGILGAGSALTIYLLWSDAARYTRRVVIPKLAIPLATIKPTEQELSHALAALREARFAIATKIQPERLMMALQRQRTG